MKEDNMSLEKDDFDNYKEFVERSLVYHDFSKIGGDKLEEILGKIEARQKDKTLKLGVVGEFSSGKSTFINALLGKELLETHVLQATTTAPTLIKYGDKLKILVKYLDGSEDSFDDYEGIFNINKIVKSFIAYFKKNKEVKIDKNAKEYINIHTANEGIAKDIYHVTICYPFKQLKDGLVIVDTPGLNAINERHHQTTKKAIRDICDTVLIIIPSGVPLSLSLLNFIKSNLLDIIDKCVFLVTKIDDIRTSEERVELVENIKYRIQNELDLDNIKIFPITTISIINKEGYEISKEDREKYNNIFKTTEKEIFNILRINKENIKKEKIRIDVLNLTKAFNKCFVEIKKYYINRLNYLRSSRRDYLKVFIEKIRQEIKIKLEKNMDKLKYQAFDDLREIYDKLYHDLEENIDKLNKKRSIGIFLRIDYKIKIKNARKKIEGYVSNIYNSADRECYSILEEFNRGFEDYYDIDNAKIYNVKPLKKDKEKKDILNEIKKYGKERKKIQKRYCSTKIRWLITIISVIAMIINFTIADKEYLDIKVFVLGSTLVIIGSYITGIIIEWFGLLISPSKEKLLNKFKNRLDKSHINSRKMVEEIFNNIKIEIDNQIDLNIQKYRDSYTDRVRDIVISEKRDIENLEDKLELCEKEMIELVNYKKRLKG